MEETKSVQFYLKGTNGAIEITRSYKFTQEQWRALAEDWLTFCSNERKIKSAGGVYECLGFDDGAYVPTRILVNFSDLAFIG